MQHATMMLRFVMLLMYHCCQTEAVVVCSSLLQIYCEGNVGLPLPNGKKHSWVELHVTTPFVVINKDRSYIVKNKNHNNATTVEETPDFKGAFTPNPFGPDFSV